MLKFFIGISFCFSWHQHRARQWVKTSLAKRNRSVSLTPHTFPSRKCSATTFAPRASLMRHIDNGKASYCLHDTYKYKQYTHNYMSIYSISMRKINKTHTESQTRILSIYIYILSIDVFIYT